jgi:hypothetical protein
MAGQTKECQSLFTIRRPTDLRPGSSFSGKLKKPAESVCHFHRRFVSWAADVGFTPNSLFKKQLIVGFLPCRMASSDMALLVPLPRPALCCPRLSSLER